MDNWPLNCQGNRKHLFNFFILCSDNWYINPKNVPEHSQSVKFPRFFADDNQPYLKIKKERKSPFELKSYSTDLRWQSPSLTLLGWDTLSTVVWGCSGQRVLDFRSFGNGWQSYRNHGFAKAISVASKFPSLDQKCRKLSSGQCSTPSSNPEQWLWEGSTCVFNLLFSRNYRQKTDREISNNSCVFPLHTRLGRTNNPCSSSQLFGKEMQAGNASQKHSLTSSILHFLHSSWHPSILPHLSSPGPTFIFLNSTANPPESKGIPRDASRDTACPHSPSHQTRPGQQPSGFYTP